MKKHDLYLAFKLAKLELRRGFGHFAVFIACLMLGVIVMASVNTFGSIVKSSLKNEAQSLLGGDIEISVRGVRPSEEQEEFLKKYGSLSSVSTLRSMLHYKDQHKLVEIKAIDENYPLLGEFSFNEITNKSAISENKQNIAVDKILLVELNLKIGDEVKIGTANYKIIASVKNEPDKAVQIFTFGPRVFMSHEALKESGLASIFSLIEYRYRILVPDNIIADDKYEKQIEAELQKKYPNISWRVKTGTDGNNALKRFFDQLLAFMSLSALATFLISGIGIGSSVRAYLSKKIQTIAVLKVQGATSVVIFFTYVFVLAFLLLFAGTIAALIAMLITSFSLPLLSEILPSLKGSTGIDLKQSLLAIWYGILIAYLFSIPAILSAINIRPALLFRSKMGIFKISHNKTMIMATIFIMLLLIATLFINANDYLFMAATIILIIVAFVLFAICNFFVTFLAKKLHFRKLWLKMAISNIHRPGATTGTVIFAIGISLTVLIALILTEANFQARINKLIEEKAPSLFMIDIQPHQKEPLTKLLLQYAQQDHVMLFPMLRGRITQINNVAVDKVKIDDDIDWAVKGDRGISYSDMPPPNANIVKGKWWDRDYQGEALLSVDVRFLKGMGVDIGDTITVNILGEEIKAKIASAREIDYSTFQMNFAMILSPNVIKDLPHTNLATIYLPTNKIQPNNQRMENSQNLEFELVAKIAKDFPGVTTIRTKEVVQMVQNIMKNIGIALRITVAISLFAGILVLVSALGATINERIYDVAVLKVLGARRTDILKSCSTEWIILAIITSLISAILGSTFAFLINLRIKGQEFYIMPEVTIATIAISVAIIWLVGYFGNRSLFAVRPSGYLRNE